MKNFTKLLKEDRNLVKGYNRHGGAMIRDGLISRFYEQDDGKLCFVLSRQPDSKDYLEEILYWVPDMDDERNILALLDVSKGIYT